MKMLERIGLVFLFIGWPTGIGIYTLKYRGCWSTKKAAAISGLCCAVGVITMVPFGIGYGTMCLLDWLYDGKEVK